VLTEYASWRWCLYINLIFAVAGVVGGLLKLADERVANRDRLDWPGVVTAVLGLVSLVYGLGNAEADGWHSPETYGFVVAGVIILAVFVAIERRVAHPLLPLRVVLDRNRGGAYASMAIAGIGLFGLFLFLTYYVTGILGFSPVQSGLAFLPLLATVILCATTLGARLTPRFGPRPMVTAGALIGAAGMVYLTRLGLHSTYVADVLPALIIIGFGMGLIFAPVQNAATSGVEHHDAGVASATLNTAQQIGGSIGTALLSSFAASAATNYLHGKVPNAQTAALASLHSFHTVFWCSAGFFVLCAIVGALVFRSGPLAVDPAAEPVIAH